MSKKNMDSSVEDALKNGEGAGELNEPAAQQPDLEQKIDELKAANADLKDKLLRMNAEFDNFRKRMNRQQIENVKLASKGIIAELLPVIDDFERAFKNMPESSGDSEEMKGMDLIKSKLLAVLQAKGLKAMESVGEPFDSNFHEAVAEIPAPSDDMKGVVLDEMEKGYYLNDTIIRYAKVIVGK